MYTLIIDNLLITQTALGILGAVLLFIFCFSLVHLARLVKFGWRYQAQNQEKLKEQPQQKPAQEPPKKQETPAPIYYIVERKRKAKTSYTEPKQIRFK